MSYAIGNVSNLLTSRANLKQSPETLAKLKLSLDEPLQLAKLPGADKLGDKKALIVGALVVAGIAAFALQRR